MDFFYFLLLRQRVSLNSLQGTWHGRRPARCCCSNWKHNGLIHDPEEWWFPTSMSGKTHFECRKTKSDTKRCGGHEFFRNLQIIQTKQDFLPWREVRIDPFTSFENCTRSSEWHLHSTWELTYSNYFASRNPQLKKTTQQDKARLKIIAVE